MNEKNASKNWQSGKKRKKKKRRKRKRNLKRNIREFESCKWRKCESENESWKCATCNGKIIYHMRRMMDFFRQHQKDAEKLIKEAERREKEEQKKMKALDANRKIKDLTARDVYIRRCNGKVLCPLQKN